MCYFHVTSNVIKNYCKYNVPLVKRKQINTEIYYIHESRNYNCIVTKNAPQQTNGHDCGVFICKFAEYASRGKTEFTFNQVNNYTLN